MSRARKRSKHRRQAHRMHEAREWHMHKMKQEQLLRSESCDMEELLATARQPIIVSDK